ncbi:3-oxoacyl-[acyl-carrier-protein] synthase II [Candidatus Gastranaerophilus sp. (ex Termes propinquus)]|nr:3-oxoacyl-[acyl-carrier-protein] synthase II [Candidatus Gastranaerophilus sp. (ex Termes propinquus)]
MKRVAITGLGLISPLGCTVRSAFERLKQYENCVERLGELDEYIGLNTRLAAPVHGFETPEYLNRKATRTMGRVAVFSVASAYDALLDANLLDSPAVRDAGVCYGSSMGAMDSLIDFYSMKVKKEIRGLNSGSYIKIMPHTAPVNISLFFKTRGRIVPSSTACTSGSMGIGYAYEAIKSGHQTVMIAGGAEELHPSQIAIFDTLYATSLKNDAPKLSPSPFDRDRDGLVIGEGAGTLILEEYEHAQARGAKIYAEIIGFATNADGSHITNPESETMGAVMELALLNSGVSPERIDYINAHGTSTLQGDVAETTAVRSVFKRAVPISSLKSYTGHTLGACGAIEALLSVEMLNAGWFAPTLNLKNVDENCGELDYIKNEGRKIDAEIIMSNNFAFGGINTSLIFKKL